MASSPSSPQSSSSDGPAPPYRGLAATHIRALSLANETLPPMLRASATAISQTTNSPINPPTSTSSQTPDSLTRRQALLSESSSTFLTLLQEVRMQLHSQIDALEAEGVIPAEYIKYVAPLTNRPSTNLSQAEQAAEQQKAQKAHDPEESVTNGGFGEFDVGVLNARAGVRQAGGEHVLERVRVVLEELVQRAEAEGAEAEASGEQRDVNG
ncbi:hypothetical protein BDV95DRAFT_49919 [Massariosphaeria phaeospora]|uniref:Mediator of RNA polymerase II transcription subunit 11 n=1 Tax=Massariosphaeria phaeospora TaxID=100035 RepID=A0A7C8I4W9_9PLEO|nr:hypothetical protein BDV95DRAFT_49919 [Massariosphaeria phaeospora]